MSMSRVSSVNDAGRTRGAMALVLMAGLVGATAGLAHGQAATAPATAKPAATAAPAAATPAATPAPVVRTTGDARRDTMIRMMKNVTVEFKDQRLEDVMTFIKGLTSADMEVMWMDDRSSSGLEKDTMVTINFAGGTALSLLEKILEKVTDDLGTGGNTWQMSESGTLQVGPRERLNVWKRTKVYPVSDLLTDIPNFTNAPEFDLQQAMQSRRGGGGGQAPFRDTNQGQQGQQDRQTRQQKLDELRNLITELVEREQWVDNGGSGASIQYFQGTFLVSAPDYVHRGLDGYDWWPSGSTAMSTVGGRRYVSLSVDTSIADSGDIRKVPVTGTAGGAGGGGAGGGGGGGNGGGGG